MEIAFLIIDMQKIFLKKLMHTVEYDSVCEHINYVADLFRKHQQTVIYIKDIESETDENKEDLDFVDDIGSKSNEPVIDKIYNNAFWKTDLEKVLHDKNIKLLVISGYAAENCVLSTYLGGNERGFKTVLLQNGFLSAKPDVITQMNRDRNLISYPVIEYLM